MAARTGLETEVVAAALVVCPDSLERRNLGLRSVLCI